jgi:hypothetical protein
MPNRNVQQFDRRKFFIVVYGMPGRNVLSGRFGGHNYLSGWILLPGFFNKDGVSGPYIFVSNRNNKCFGVYPMSVRYTVFGIRRNK